VLDDVLAEIDRQGGYELGVGPEPIVSLELFFDGNDDLGSMGCNLVDHPGISVFYSTLVAIRARPDVFDVRVGISEVLQGDGEWPFSDHVYVVTSAAPDEVDRWASALQPDPAWLASRDDEPQHGPLDVPAHLHVVMLWWD
jgi:hypothetical protein